MHFSATKSELEILLVLWEAGKPLSRAEILALSTEKHWKDNSIHILLNGMLEKQLIQSYGFARSGKVWGRLYGPTVSPEDYFQDVFCSSLLDPLLIFQALLQRSDVNAEKKEKMRKLLMES